mgnify:CR=1 FL=1
MAITTYAELQTAIQNYFDDSVELTSARVQEHIDLGETMINRVVRAREMETTSDLSISSQNTSLPTGFLGARRVYLNTDPIRTLEFFSPDDFWRREAVNQTNTPQIYTIEADNLVVAPSPSSTIPGKLLYWARSNIASSVPDLFANHPDLYVAAASIWTAEYLEDTAKEAKAAVMVQTIIDQIKTSDDRDRYSGAPLISRTDTPSLDQ